MKLGTTELIVILVIIILLFGPTQIPKLMKMFGKSMKSFRDGMNEDEAVKTDSSETAAKNEQ